MRILIIGGTGFIGPYVARDLHHAGHEVTVFHRGQHESRLPSEVRHIRSSDASMPVLKFPQVLLSTDFDVVIHMIAMGEADARAAVQAFSGRAQRIVALSSGDVYAAYGRFTKLENGQREPGLLGEDSPLRKTLYPYRAHAKSDSDLNYFYEKILVEREMQSDPSLAATILRLPKVYGPGNNDDLATVYAYRDHPFWRWTHGYVENVAAAIVLAALHPTAANRIYNVGEEFTPTVAERLATLPEANIPVGSGEYHDFRHDIAYDTSRIRQELRYEEPVAYEEGLRRTFAARKR